LHGRAVRISPQEPQATSQFRTFSSRSLPPCLAEGHLSACLAEAYFAARGLGARQRLASLGSARHFWAALSSFRQAHLSLHLRGLGQGVPWTTWGSASFVSVDDDAAGHGR